MSADALAILARYDDVMNPLPALTEQVPRPRLLQRLRWHMDTAASRERRLEFVASVTPPPVTDGNFGFLYFAACSWARRTLRGAMMPITYQSVIGSSLGTDHKYGVATLFSVLRRGRHELAAPGAFNDGGYGDDDANSDDAATSDDSDAEDGADQPGRAAGTASALVCRVWWTTEACAFVRFLP